MGEYEQQILVERAKWRKLGHAVGCALIADLIFFFILPAIFGRWVWWPFVVLLIIVPLAAWAGWRWFDPARDWAVLQAYRLRGRF